ncbi:MAG: TonB-dependent receptor plug domain-containing protein, partial [Candidatus Omnitrophica bacterium]|nr:TonB-dependent receptor plug domain-containing protein [Candidatus Omnitrophota bacterium]
MRAQAICGFFILFLFAAAFGQDEVGLEPIVVVRDAGLKENYLVDRQGLDVFSPAGVIESLRYAPVDIQRRGDEGAQADFSLRASSFEGVLLLVDGHRANDPQSGHFNCDLPLTKEDIQAIEVMPGARSPLAGSGATGGSLAITTKKPDVTGMVFESRIGLHQSHTQLASITRSNKDMGVRFSLESKEKDGFRDDTDLRSLTATSAWSLELPGQHYGVNAGYQEKEFGAYDFYTPGRGYPSREWTKTIFLSGDAGFELEHIEVKPGFSWRRHFDKFMLDKSGQRSLYLNHHRTDTYVPGLRLQARPGFLDTLGVGTEYTAERIHSTQLGAHARSRSSFYLDAARSLGNAVSLEGAVRLDDGTRPADSLMYSLKGHWKVWEGFYVRSALSSHIRLPSFTELYYGDPTTRGN